MTKKHFLTERMDLLRRITEQFFHADWKAHGKWFVLSAMVGVVAGCGAIVFQFLTQAVMYGSLGLMGGYHPGEPHGEHTIFPEIVGPLNPWLIAVVATMGGVLSGWLVYTFAPEAEGHGTDAAIDAFHNKRGAIRPRVPLIKTIASALTIGTGGSGGREGPIAQIGAGFGSFLGARLKLRARDRRILMAAGMGAGVGAIFRAPLAGALFAAEILYSDSEFEAEVVVPAAMSSIVAYTVYTLSLPPALRYEPLFGGELKYVLASPLELIPYAILSVVMVAVAVLYIKVFYGTHRLFNKLPGPRMFRPAIGACAAALIGIGLWFAFGKDNRVLAVLATGYGTLQEALAGTDTARLPSILLLTVAFAKIVTTSLTIGSGGSGGVFGPSMVVGGCTGAAVGQFFHDRWPQVVQQPGAFALVGMAGFFAGAAHAPISTIIMVSEMTGDYKLLLPTMFCSTLCFVMCRRWKLYTKQVPSRLESPAHRGDFIVDMLEGIKVAEVYRPLDQRVLLIPESMPLQDIVHRLAETNQHYFPVMDSDGQLVGIFSSQDVRRYLYDESIWDLALANDIMVTKVISVTPEDDLNTALTRFTSRNLDELPVVAAGNPGQLLGMLRRKETIAYYNRRLIEHKQVAAE